MEDKLKDLSELLADLEKQLKKISEELNKKPREFWIQIDHSNMLKCHIFACSEHARPSEIIHLREVVDE